MALTPCRDCGSQVSTEATACPTCGAPAETQIAPGAPSRFSILNVAAAGATIIAFVIGKLIPALPFWGYLLIFLVSLGGWYSAQLRYETKRRAVSRM